MAEYTQEELNLLAKLGMSAKDAAKLIKTTETIKEKKKVLMDEYYLVKVKKCKLCSTHTTTIFKMANEFDEATRKNFLLSFNVDCVPDDAKTKVEEYFSLTCDKCQDILLTKSVEELTAMCIYFAKKTF